MSLAPHATPPAAAPTGAYPSLLARYIAGDLDAATLDALCDALDETPATADERRAFARFYLDAMREREADVALPTPTEIADVLTIARA